MSKLIQTARRFGLTTLAVFSLSLPALADPKPRPSKAVDPQSVATLFGGKTWEWSKGGSYWGARGEFQAIWKDSVGIGRWYVTTKGALCYEATWTWSEGNDTITRCSDHVFDKAGQLWQRNPDNGDWYKFRAEEELKKGNKIKAEVRKRKKKFGI